MVALPIFLINERSTAVSNTYLEPHNPHRPVRSHKNELKVSVKTALWARLRIVFLSPRSYIIRMEYSCQLIPCSSKMYLEAPFHIHSGTSYNTLWELTIVTVRILDPCCSYKY